MLTTPYHGASQVHHWSSVLFTDELNFTLSIFDICERVWRICGEYDVACNITQYDWPIAYPWREAQTSTA